MSAKQFLTKNLIKDHIRPNDQIPRCVSCNQMNERITEDIVRDILKANQKKYSKVKIEEQKSKNPRIKKLLKNASKSGSGGGGRES